MRPALRRAAEKLKAPPPGLAAKGAVIRKGVVVSYSSGRATITVGGDSTHIDGCPSIACSPGDNVLVLQQPPLLPVVIIVLT
jgi:hypothetical protein